MIAEVKTGGVATRKSDIEKSDIEDEKAENKEKETDGKAEAPRSKKTTMKMLIEGPPKLRTLDILKNTRHFLSLNAFVDA